MDTPSESPDILHAFPVIGPPGSMERKRAFVRMRFRKHGMEPEDHVVDYMVTVFDLAAAGKLPPGFQPEYPDFDTHRQEGGAC